MFATVCGSDEESDDGKCKAYTPRAEDEDADDCEVVGCGTFLCLRGSGVAGHFSRRIHIRRHWRARSSLRRKYKFGAILGAGADAYVCRAVRRHDGAEVAIKVLDRERAYLEQRGIVDEPNDEELFKILELTGQTSSQPLSRWERVSRELSIHSRLPRHAHIVPCLGVFDGAKKAYLVLGMCAGGTLLDRITGSSDDSAQLLSQMGAASIAMQVLEAVAFLHSLGIVHRDIKLENLLLRDTRGAYVMLGDFGSARHFDKSASSGERNQFARAARQPTMRVGTLAYMAPEQLVGGSLDTALDMWSVGIVLTALCTGRHPLRDVPRRDWHAEMVRDRLPDGASPDAAEAWAELPQARDLVRQMLRHEPRHRVSAAQALEHPWIVSYAAAEAERGECVEQLASLPAQKKSSSFFGAAWRSAWRSVYQSAPRVPDAPQAPPEKRLDDDGLPVVKVAFETSFETSFERRSERDSLNDVLRLPRVLQGLRETQHTRLQKVLQLAVALRADDKQVRAALALFESLDTRGDGYLTREDVEDALLGDDISLRACDELVDVFAELALDDSSGRVTVGEFVGGALSLRRRSRREVVEPVLRSLDPQSTHRVNAAQLASVIRGATDPNQAVGDSTAERVWVLPADAPSETEIQALISALESGDGSERQPDLSYDEVVDLLFSP